MEESWLSSWRGFYDYYRSSNRKERHKYETAQDAHGVAVGSVEVSQ